MNEGNLVATTVADQLQNGPNRRGLVEVAPPVPFEAEHAFRSPRHRSPSEGRVWTRLRSAEGRGRCQGNSRRGHRVSGVADCLKLMATDDLDARRSLSWYLGFTMRLRVSAAIDLVEVFEARLLG